MEERRGEEGRGGEGRGECVKVKVPVRALDIAPLRETPPQKRSGVARVIKGSHRKFFLHTHTFIRNRNEPYLPLPSQLYDWYISTPEAELAWVAGYIVRQFTVTHLTTQCRALLR